jgi:hypothetical protein
MTDLPPPPAAPPTTASRTSVPLLVASTLCWIWGILLFFAALATGIAFLAIGLYMALLVPVILLILVAFYVTAGIGIRRRKKWGAIVGVVIAALYVALAMLGLATTAAAPQAAQGGSLQQLVSGVLGLVVNASIIILLIVRWRELE